MDTHVTFEDVPGPADRGVVAISVKYGVDEYPDTSYLGEIVGRNLSTETYAIVANGGQKGEFYSDLLRRDRILENLRDMSDSAALEYEELCQDCIEAMQNCEYTVLDQYEAARAKALRRWTILSKRYARLYAAWDGLTYDALPPMSERLYYVPAWSPSNGNHKDKAWREDARFSFNRLDRLSEGDWCFSICNVTVEFHVKGKTLSTSESLCGIESDATSEYRREVENDLLASCMSVLEALEFDGEYLKAIVEKFEEER